MEWNIAAGRPVYLQLIEQLELGLLTGEFPPGSRIPPVRELAAAAGVNPNTMQRALQELETAGLLQAQRTAGRTVTADAAALGTLRRERAAVVAAACWRQLQALGLTNAEAIALLRSTEPAPEAIPAQNAPAENKPEKTQSEQQPQEEDTNDATDL